MIEDDSEDNFEKINQRSVEIREEVRGFDSAARQLIIIDSLIIFFFSIISCTGLFDIFLLNKNYTQLVIVINLVWFLSLCSSILVIRPNAFSFRNRFPKGKNAPYFAISFEMLKQSHKYKHKYLNIAYILFLAGFVWLIITASLSMISTVENDNFLKVSRDFTDESSRFYLQQQPINPNQINANISEASFIIQRGYLGGNMIGANQTNATGLAAADPFGIGYFGSVIIALGLMFAFIVIMWQVGKGRTDKWWDYPLGMPNGSIRALIALLFVIIILLYGEQPQPWLMGIVGTIIGFYFGERMGKEKG
jgi:hypothetical protein